MSRAPRANTRLVEGCDAYLVRITNEGQSQTSIRTARYALARFQKAVAISDPNPYLHLITAGHVDDYCYGTAGIRRDIKAISFNRYRSVLVNFFNYALAMRWVDTNPMDSIAPARPDTPVSRLLLNATELLALLEQAASPVERIACSLGMNTGLRANDIRHLKVFDASLAGGTIQTEIRKTRKLDVKPITLELGRELVAWLDTYAHVMGLQSRQDLPNDWLLVPVPVYKVGCSKREIITFKPTDVHSHPWRLVQRPLGRLGYPTKGEGFHTLRRSSARALFESLRSVGELGRDHALMVVKDFLNHASVAQTEHYLGLNQERTIRDELLRDQPFLSRLAQTEQARVAPQPRPLKEPRYGT